MVWYLRWPVMLVLGIAFWFALEVHRELPRDGWASFVVGVVAFTLAVIVGAIPDPKRS